MKKAPSVAKEKRHASLDQYQYDVQDNLRVTLSKLSIFKYSTNTPQTSTKRTP